MTKPIKLFRPGTFTSVEGKKLNFSEADLQAIAEAYDPTSDPAPLVVGHPKLEDPAFGWVDGLRIDDGILIADPGQVEPAFAEAVNAGRYRKISAQFYDPGSPANPKPGGWYLKHIGFLGAAAPSVKGLGTVAFAGDPADPVTTIEESIMSDKDNTNTSFAEAQAEIDRQREALAAKEATLTTREQSVSQVLHASHVSFAEGLVSNGRLLPAGKDTVVGLLDRLEGNVEATASFGEGDKAISPAAAFRSLFDGTQPMISFGEAAAPTDDDEGGTVSFAAPQGFDVDAKRLEIHERALQLQAANSSLSYVQAVKQAGG